MPTILLPTHPNLKAFTLTNVIMSNTMTNDKTTHFGFKQVDQNDKEGLVRGVFDSVADK